MKGAFEGLKHNTLRFDWITLQAYKVEVMKKLGGIEYLIPHMNKTKLAREKRLLENWIPRHLPSSNTTNNNNYCEASMKTRSNKKQQNQQQELLWASRKTRSNKKQQIRQQKLLWASRKTRSNKKQQTKNHNNNNNNNTNSTIASNTTTNNSNQPAPNKIFRVKYSYSHFWAYCSGWKCLGLNIM